MSQTRATVCMHLSKQHKLFFILRSIKIYTKTLNNYNCKTNKNWQEKLSVYPESIKTCVDVCEYDRVSRNRIEMLKTKATKIKCDVKCIQKLRTDTHANSYTHTHTHKKLNISILYLCVFVRVIWTLSLEFYRIFCCFVAFAAMMIVCCCCSLSNCCRYCCCCCLCCTVLVVFFFGTCFAYFVLFSVMHWRQKAAIPFHSCSFFIHSWCWVPIFFWFCWCWCGCWWWCRRRRCHCRHHHCCCMNIWHTRTKFLAMSQYAYIRTSIHSYIHTDTGAYKYASIPYKHIISDRYNGLKVQSFWIK